MRLIILSMALLLSGCASSTAIQRVSSSESGFDGAIYSGQLDIINDDNSREEQYRVFHQGASSFVSVQTIRESAEKRITEFCKRQGKVFKTLSEQTSQPPHILGNFPRIEIIFVCVESTKI